MLALMLTYWLRKFASIILRGVKEAKEVEVNKKKVDIPYCDFLGLCRNAQEKTGHLTLTFRTAVQKLKDFSCYSQVILWEREVN